MGLIKAGVGALGGTLADQWKEFFYCEAMSKDVMVTKGQKRITGRSSNTRGNDNIISNGSVTLPDEDAEMIKQLQRTAVMRDPTMAGATIVGAQADAMRAAAANEGGAMNGFIGMGMAMNAGGMNAQNLFAMGQQQQQQPPAPAPAAPQQDGWKCSCGAMASGNFCPQCGAKKPEGAHLYRCDKCGWEPADPHNPLRFCPECGDPFDDSDKQ